MFATILLRRLLDAGADGRVSESQFGFRPKRGTEDALHCARRAVDRAWAHKSGRIHLLALDWKKAFDSINSEGLLLALRRFGLPDHFLKIIRAIYTDRNFHVADSGITSSCREQNAGICQGCPLSPFLFVAVMTIPMADAHASLGTDASDALKAGVLYDLLYADDTLIMGSQAKHVEELARAVEASGAQYGMTLHWGKTHALSVCTDETLRAPDFSIIEGEESIIYLGALISSDGRADSEISRRIGLASAEFKQLKQVWNHANVPRAKKIDIFQAFVISKLAYGLCTLWTVKSQQRRLDGFYARCLRKIMGIPAAFVSRISNAKVFTQAGAQPLSLQIERRRCALLGRIGRSPEGSALRKDTFWRGSAIPTIGLHVRRRGRPRQEWTSQVMSRARSAFASGPEFEASLLDTSSGSASRWMKRFPKQ